MILIFSFGISHFLALNKTPPFAMKALYGQSVTLFGKTGLKENSVVMHFECADNAF